MNIGNFQYKKSRFDFYFNFSQFYTQCIKHHYTDQTIIKIYNKTPITLPCFSMSKNRYDTLDVNLNLSNVSSPKKQTQRFSNTIDFEASNLSIHQQSVQNDDRVNKFRDLYYKNEKLRKQLKLLNVKLNQKLEKVKLAPVKRKKAQSVDLNYTKPSKALQRQLENGYKQIQMYKKRIIALKVKEESQSTYQKYKTLENDISYKDIEIGQVQQELKSLKGIKKLQDRTMVQDLQNEDLKEKLHQYEAEFKQGQAKLKQINKKARKREQQYKKQQAYQVALEKKLRKGIAEQAEEQPVFNVHQLNNTKPPEHEVSQAEFKAVKQQIANWKIQNQIIQKKMDISKKNIRDFKKNRKENQDKLKERQIDIKALGLKLQSYSRLIRDYEKKATQQQNTKFNTNFNSINSIDDDQSRLKSSLKMQDQIDFDSQQSDQDQDIEFNKKPFQMSIPASTIKKGEREWTGKPRKVVFGFMDSKDAMHKFTGNLLGLKIWIDDSQLICGLAFIYQEDEKVKTTKESGVMGSKTNIELKWELQKGNHISRIDSSFTEQGYLSQILISTRNGLSAKFGNQSSIDKFNLILDQREQLSGFSSAIRKLGQDTRVTQLGFWVVKKN